MKDNIDQEFIDASMEVGLAIRSYCDLNYFQLYKLKESLEKLKEKYTNTDYIPKSTFYYLYGLKSDLFSGLNWSKGEEQKIIAKFSFYYDQFFEELLL